MKSTEGTVKFPPDWAGLGDHANDPSRFLFGFIGQAGPGTLFGTVPTPVKLFAQTLRN
jgi:hypothetical protein